MALPRIRIAKDKGELVQLLAESSNAPFTTYADVMAFAAALGSQQGKRRPMDAIAKEPAPISLEIFISRGYDWMIKLLAMSETEDPAILSPFEQSAEEQRILIFEEYANAGLERLQNELRGSLDYSERLLLFINSIRFEKEKISGEFDLSRFL